MDRKVDRPAKGEREQGAEREPLTVRQDPGEPDASPPALAPRRPFGFATTVKMSGAVKPPSMEGGPPRINVKKSEFPPAIETMRMPSATPSVDGAQTVLDAKLPPELQAAFDAAERAGSGGGGSPRVVIEPSTMGPGAQTLPGPFQPVAPPTVATPRFQATLIDLNPPTEMQHEIEEAPATVRKPGATQSPKDAAAAAPGAPGAVPPVAGDAAAGRGWEARAFGGAPAAQPPNAQAYAPVRPIPVTPPPAAGRGYSPPTPALAAGRKRGSEARFFAHDDDARWLDRYELITEIASGGMATVFLGRLQGAGGFQRLVAIKRLLSNLAEDPEFVEMFVAEARIAAQIHHTNVVPLLEIGSSPRGYYLVMEYIEGVTLGQLNQRVWQTELPVPRRIALRIMLDALAGLNAAHELTDEAGRLLGIVHRDCSPQNIIIGVDGTGRLTDFGVARATTRLSNTRAGTIKGKVAYMAPEQIKRGQLDRRADLFAMGVIMWEALAGQALFRADTRLDTILQALNAPVPRLSEVTFGVPPELEEVCAKALAREPEARFQSAVEMAEAIELAARGAIASSREVAAFLVKLFGRDFNDRRASIRAWLDAATTAAGPSSPLPRAPQPSVPQFSPAPRAPLQSYPMPPYGGGYAAPLPAPVSPRQHPGGPYPTSSPTAVTAVVSPPATMAIPFPGSAVVPQAGPHPNNPRPGLRPGPSPGAAPPPVATPDATTTTRQYVGSLTPLHLDSEEPSELPMRGLVFSGATPAGVPARARPLLRGVLLAAGIALVAVLAAVLWWIRRSRADEPAPAAPPPTSMASTQSGDAPLPTALLPVPTPTPDAQEPAAPTAATSAPAPSVRAPAASPPPGAAPSAKASADDLANPYR